MHPYTHTHIAHSGTFFWPYRRTAVHPMCCHGHPVFFGNRLAGGSTGALIVFDRFPVSLDIAAEFLSKNDPKKRQPPPPPDPSLSYK